MCTTCGCASGEVRLEGDAPDAGGHTHHHHGEAAHEHWHRHADGTWHMHSHDHQADHRHSHGSEAVAAAAGTAYRPAPSQEHLHYGQGAAGAHAPGLSQAQMVRIEQDILGKNNGYAVQNRRWFADHGVFALNLVSSPGSGKTTLLVRTIEALAGKAEVAVVEGDQQTSQDAERIRATGARALQINTGKGCHLDAHMVGQALERLRPADDSLLMIENVGNLVCPAAFDLGEAHKVVILSVTEGEDKPLKYPDMFAAADLMLLNKCDLLPYLSFDVERAVEHARRINPRLAVIKTSATSGEGFDEWLEWLLAGLSRARAGRAETVEALRARVTALEAQLVSRRE